MVPITLKFKPWKRLSSLHPLCSLLGLDPGTPSLWIWRIILWTPRPFFRSLLAEVLCTLYYLLYFFGITTMPTSSLIDASMSQLLAEASDWSLLFIFTQNTGFRRWSTVTQHICCIMYLEMFKIYTPPFLTLITLGQI